MRNTQRNTLESKEAGESIFKIKRVAAADNLSVIGGEWINIFCEFMNPCALL
jgi:hypothetical protein